MTHTLVDAAWRQQEIPDHDAEPCAPAEARCAECGRETAVLEMWFGAREQLLCPSC